MLNILAEQEIENDDELKPEEANDNENNDIEKFCETASDVDEDDGDRSLARQEDEDSKNIKNDPCKCSYNIILFLFL